MTGRKSTTTKMPGRKPAGSEPMAPGMKTSLPTRTRRMHVRRVEVTQDDIDKAVRGNSHSCMIAEAIKREVPHARNVAVDIQTIRLTDTKGKRRVSFLTPPKARFGLLDFDRGVPVKPFHFEMRSIQITAQKVTKPKLDAEGNPVKKTVRYKRRLPSGEVVVKTMNRTVREDVSVPTSRRTFVNNDERMRPGSDHIIGGRLPGHEKNSPARLKVDRRFGMRAYTWDAGEDPAAVSARLAAAHGAEVE